MSAPPPVPPPPAAGTVVAVPRPGRRTRIAVVLLFVVVALLAAGGWWALRSNFDRQQAQIAAVQRQVSALVEHSEQRARERAQALERLQSELAQLRAQREALEQLHLDLMRGRDESALIEVERLITLAAHELQLAGNAAGALSALQLADAKLARVERPPMVELRRALARDLERLRAAPRVDLTGIAIRLDRIVQGVDALPLLAQATPPALVRPAAPAAAETAPPSRWDALRAWLQREFGDLLRIREVDTPQALLLSDGQQRLLRQQLTLRLLGARHAALARHDALYRAELGEAQALLARYFDTRQAAVAAAQSQVRELIAAPLAVDLPRLESLAALPAARRPNR